MGWKRTTNVELEMESFERKCEGMIWKNEIVKNGEVIVRLFNSFVSDESNSLCYV